ncbi:MAG: hypothetical protein ACOYEV_09365 [Candidatus Nanopelagicales bacterium]
MSETIDLAEQLGPLEHLVITAPGGQLTQEFLAPLLALVEAGTIFVLDIEAVVRSGETVQVADTASLGLPQLAGAGTGLLDDADLQMVGEGLPDGGLALVIIYEDAWVSTLAAEVAAAGGELTSQGPVEVTDVLSRLDELESSGSGDSPAS